jgi:hypothetical protein
MMLLILRIIKMIFQNYLADDFIIIAWFCMRSFSNN